MPNRPSTHQYHATVPNGSHTQRVVNELGLSIVSGQRAESSLLPGDAEFLALYGVSRTVLREAVKTLSAKGLLQAKARIGTRVRPRDEWNLFDPDVLIWHAQLGFSSEFLIHLGEMRLALEPEAAALAARRRTPSQLVTIRDCIDEMSNPTITPDEFVRADLGFHLAVADAAGNPFFLSISTLIEVALVAMLTVSSPAEDAVDLAASVAQHRAIAEAIAASNERDARLTMQGVIQKGIDRSKP